MDAKISLLFFFWPTKWWILFCNGESYYIVLIQKREIYLHFGFLIDFTFRVPTTKLHGINDIFLWNPVVQAFKVFRHKVKIIQFIYDFTTIFSCLPLNHSHEEILISSTNLKYSCACMHRRVYLQVGQINSATFVLI